MTSYRRRRIEEIYDAALMRGEHERVAFLASACSDDDELRHEVELLLANRPSAQGLNSPAVTGAPHTISDHNSRLAGRRLGAYQVRERIGVGGMGEVYRARDTKLGRDVAIKILPPHFTTDPERLARFQREARVLAALNNPHIAAIYGFEDTDGIHALVLELVDGETLAERIRRGPIPPKEALAIADQIIDALDAAHEKGVVHRDLKPSNIKIGSGGLVKVLDFGLAKMAPAESAVDITNAPTITVDATQEGVILGTAPYMSPEQARGQGLDKRTDIWAFGCVLYEMLTGRCAFARGTVTDTLAAIVEQNPDWQALPRSTSSGIRYLLQRCFEKDPKFRLRDIGEARFLMIREDQNALQSRGRRTGTRELLAWSIAVSLGASLSVLSFRTFSPTVIPGPVLPSRTIIPLVPGQSLETGDGQMAITVSPDGNRIAYIAEENGNTQLFVRELSQLAAKAIAGTTGARHPFFSPDGEWVAFFANGALQKVALAGGAPLRLCNVTARSRGGTWGPDGTIIFALAGSDLQRLDAAGGTPQALTGSAPASWPEILPDGKSVLFATGGPGHTGFALAALDGSQKRVIARLADSPLEGPAVLGTGGTLVQARYIARGYLVYGQSPGKVQAVPFDLGSLRVTGSPMPIVDLVEQAPNGGGVYFGVSQTGLLVYASTGNRHQLVWVDRTGNVTPISEDRAAFREPRLSPDGARIAVAISDDTRRSDIWLYEAARGTKTRLTTSKHNLSPVWAPDGKHLTFSEAGDIVDVTVAGGTAKSLLAADPAALYASSWSPDGDTLLYHRSGASGWDVFSLTRAPGSVPKLLFSVGQVPAFAQFSPDGRWLAFVSDESGRGEIYVGSVPDLAEKIVVSTGGGTRPHWSHDGRELFYRQADGLMAVSVNLGATLSASKPHRLFAGAFTGESRDVGFDVSPDDQRFLMVKSDEAAALRQLTVVQNWVPQLGRRMP